MHQPTSQSPPTGPTLKSILSSLILTLSLTTSTIAALNSNSIGAAAGKQVGFAPNWKALREGNFRPSFHGAAFAPADFSNVAAASASEEQQQPPNGGRHAAGVISNIADLQLWRGLWGQFKAPSRVEWSSWVKRYPALASVDSQTPVGVAITTTTAYSTTATSTSSPSPSVYPTHTPGEQPADQYIIAMHYHINATQVKEHIDWIFSIIKSHNVFGFTDDQLSKFRGVIGQLECDFFHGYIGHLPEWIIALIEKDPYVRFVEKDQYIQVGQTRTTTTAAAAPSPSLSLNSSNPLVNPKQFLVIPSGDNHTVGQANPPWGLDRISHRESGFKGLYAYPADGGQNVDVYILDTGVNINHTDFEGRARYGQSFSDQGNNDGNGHGTHVAGIAAGKTYGVAKSANIVSIKVLDDDGTGPISAVISGIDWVVNNRNTSRRAVINMSLGRGGKSQAMNDIVTAAVNSAGIVFAAAAGNDNVNACGTSPADSGSVLTVGASDETDTKASFSNWGSCVDIFAPGTNITSASSRTSTDTRVYSGTSQAAPHVAGMMAIMLHMFPDITPTVVYATLKQIGTSGVLKGTDGLSGTPNLLLFNGVNSTNLASEARSAGDGSSFGWESFKNFNGGWKLVGEISWWVWI
ncbi:serine protease [Rhizophlyctis rosea]|nr:serine protease [Rhizophlyctis rosea]